MRKACAYVFLENINVCGHSVLEIKKLWNNNITMSQNFTFNITILQYQMSQYYNIIISQY